MLSKLVPIALIARPHGIDGELRLKLYNEDTTLISKGRTVTLIYPKPVVAPAKGVEKKGEAKKTPAEPEKKAPVEGRKATKAPDPKPVEGKKLRISSVRETTNGLLIRFEGESGRDAAEALRGVEIAVPREELPDLEGGEFYACDVEGARVELTHGEVIGTVAELVTYPTCNVFRIVLVDGKTIEVPVVDGYVAEVDTDSHLIKLHHIDDL